METKTIGSLLTERSDFKKKPESVGSSTKKDSTYSQEEAPSFLPTEDPLRSFPTYESFLRAYDPSLQTFAVCHPARCFDGNAPTLAQVARKYGNGYAYAWVYANLIKYSEDAFNSAKMKQNSLMSCAKYLCGQFYWMKCSEVLLFFGYCTLGKYDDYVGSKLDIPAVMKAMRQFVNQDRANHIAKLEVRS